MENRQYFGFLISQRLNSEAVHFFVFCARAQDIVQWAGIRRTAVLPKGSQRILRPGRKRAVTQFLMADTMNTIPNNILLAFEPKVASFTPLDIEFKDLNQNEQSFLIGNNLSNSCDNQLSWGVLCFSFEPNAEEHLRPALIVDGQHRLYGINDCQQENIPVVVVGLIDASPQEQAFQFIVINKKAVSVSTDDAKSIIADYNEEELGTRLAKVRIDYGDAPPLLRYFNDSDSSPFRGLLKWPYNRDANEDYKFIPITAIEQSMNYLKTSFSFLKGDDDDFIEIFSVIWESVKLSYPELWAINDKFMRKVNINALNEYIVDKIKTAWTLDFLDILEIDQVKVQVVGLLKRLPKEYWINEWSLAIKDNLGFRKMIKDDLEVLSDNCKLGNPWNLGLNLPVSGESD